MTDITQPIRDALVEIIVADSGREMMQARYEFDKTCTPDALIAVLARLDAAEATTQRVIEYALDEADEWQRFVEVDNAPMSNRAYIQRAIDAAMKGKP